MRCSYCQLEVPEEICYADGDRNPICVSCYEEALTVALHYVGAYVNMPRGYGDIASLAPEPHAPSPAGTAQTPRAQLP